MIIACQTNSIRDRPLTIGAGGLVGGSLNSIGPNFRGITQFGVVLIAGINYSGPGGGGSTNFNTTG